MQYGEIFYTTKFGSSWYWLLKKECISCRFRVDPVPSTGKSTRYRNYLRYPKTTQERRYAEAHKGYIRGRRSKCNLPNAWDDIYRSNVSNKSWKNQKKKKQWM